MDEQVTNILYGAKGLINTPFWNNTMIVFTSDHGDYGGSHGLHSKGGGLYDEVLNVPLFISYPEARASTQTAPIPLPYVCSGVDLLPFLYYIALGNNSWRYNPADIVYYLNGREAIHDAIFEYNYFPNPPVLVQQRRISNIPLHVQQGPGNPDWQNYQPFVLHTADDYALAWIPPALTTSQPSHAIAFRTVDPTDSSSGVNGQTQYGGAKLGIYSFWNTCNPPIANAPIKGLSNIVQYGSPCSLASTFTPQTLENPPKRSTSIGGWCSPLPSQQTRAILGKSGEKIWKALSSCFARLLARTDSATPIAD